MLIGKENFSGVSLKRRREDEEEIAVKRPCTLDLALAAFKDKDSTENRFLDLTNKLQSLTAVNLNKECDSLKLIEKFESLQQSVGEVVKTSEPTEQLMDFFSEIKRQIESLRNEHFLDQIQTITEALNLQQVQIATSIFKQACMDGNLSGVRKALQNGAMVEDSDIDQLEVLQNVVPMMEKVVKAYRLFQTVNWSQTVTKSQILETCFSTLSNSTPNGDFKYHRKNPGAGVPFSTFTFNNLLLLTFGNKSATGLAGGSKKMQKGCLIEMEKAIAAEVCILRNYLKNGKMTNIPINEAKTLLALNRVEGIPKTYLHIRYNKFKKIDQSNAIECRHVFFVQELFQGSLESLRLENLHAAKLHPLVLKERIEISEKALQSLVNLHATGRIHGDIKPLNILFSKLHDGSFQIANTDFGVSFSKDEECANLLKYGYGTFTFTAPETLTKALGQAPNQQADAYAMGLTLLYLGERKTLVTWTSLMTEYLEKLNAEYWNSKNQDLSRTQALKNVITLAKKPEMIEHAKKIRRLQAIMNRYAAGLKRKKIKTESECLQQIVFGLLQLDPAKRLTPVQALTEVRELKSLRVNK